MFRPDSRIIQPCGDGVDLSDLAVFILTEIGFHAVEDSQAAGGDGGGILIRIDTVSGGFASHQRNTRLVDEVVEEPHGVAAAADAGDQHVRKLSFGFHKLGFYFLADNALEITDDRGERMRPHDGTQHIVGVLHAVRPFTPRFVDGIL